LSSAAPLINIYICTMFNFNQDMAQTGIHYEKNKWLWGDNSVNIHGRTMVLIHNTSSGQPISK